MKKLILIALALFSSIASASYSETLVFNSLSRTNFDGTTLYEANNFTLTHETVETGEFVAKLNGVLLCGHAYPYNSTIPNVYRIHLNNCNSDEKFSLTIFLRYDEILDRYVLPITGGTRPRVISYPSIIHSNDNYIESGSGTF